MRWAVMTETGFVENVVEWDGVTQWAPPPGRTVVLLPDEGPVSPGMLVDSKGNLLSTHLHGLHPLLGVPEEELIELRRITGAD